MTVDSLLDSISNFLGDPQRIKSIISVLIICITCFIAGSLMRLIFGRRATAARAVTTVLGILMTYIITHLLIAAGSPLSQYLPSLPFVKSTESAIEVFSLNALESQNFTYQLVNLILLAFLFGLMDDLLPGGKNIFVWLILRCVSILSAYLGFILVNSIFTEILPGFILQYAPVILLTLLVLFLAVTVFKWLIGMVLGISGGPVIGAIYTFFVSNLVGKQLTKAALTSGLFYLLIYLANRFEYTSITIGSPFNLFTFFTIGALTMVWYCIYKIF